MTDPSIVNVREFYALILIAVWMAVVLRTAKSPAVRDPRADHAPTDSVAP